jgi:hypothetical protein
MGSFYILVFKNEAIHLNGSSSFKWESFINWTFLYFGRQVLCDWCFEPPECQ